MNDDAHVWHLAKSADEKNASRRCTKINGAESSIRAVCSFHLIQMPDEDDGATRFLSDPCNAAHHGADLVCAVDVGILTNVALDGIEDHQLRTRCFDRRFDALVLQR